jgi:hypothetical protein
MLTSSVILDFKAHDSVNLALDTLRAKSSLENISLKKSISRSKSKGKYKLKVKSSKNSEGITTQMTQISKYNRKLKEKISEAISDIKKFKPISKDLKNKEFDNLHKEFKRSEEEIGILKKKLNKYEEIMKELYNHTKSIGNEPVLHQANSDHRSLKISIPRNALSVEDLILRPESVRNGLKTARNSNLKSPYDSKIFNFSNKKLKKIQNSGYRSHVMTPSVKNITEIETPSTEISKKMSMTLDRLKNLLNIRN